MTPGAPPSLLSVDGLCKSYRTKHGVLKAVDKVSFSIGVGETVAVVGESGCGKSTLAMVLLGLVPSDSGMMALDGAPPAPISRVLKGRSKRDIGVVFQNPHSSLNPKMKVRSIVGEPLIAAFGMRGRSLTDRVTRLLQSVGLGFEHMRRYPHELSGGQMQRVAIARALALEPRLLILDEPTAALDVSVQAQILKLLRALQKDVNVSFLFITHDLGTVDYIADHVIVMYLGRIVESGPVADVFSDPRHPYTRALLDAVPTIDPRKRGEVAVLSGELPSPLHRPRGCPFSPRCRWRSDRCRQIEPMLQSAGRDRAFACYHPLSLVDGTERAGNADRRSR